MKTVKHPQKKFSKPARTKVRQVPKNIAQKISNNHYSQYIDTAYYFSHINYGSETLGKKRTSRP